MVVFYFVYARDNSFIFIILHLYSVLYWVAIDYLIMFVKILADWVTEPSF